MELTQVEKFSEVMCGLCDNIKGMMSDLYELGYNRLSPRLLNAIKAYLLDKDQEDIVRKFIDGSMKFWDEMREHNENFFVNNIAEVFGSLPYPKEIKEFSRLFLLTGDDGERLLPEEDRDLIWEHFDSMISICIVYIHQQRVPGVKKDGDKAIACYTKSFYPDLKLAKQARLWGVKLEW